MDTELRQKLVERLEELKDNGKGLSAWALEFISDIQDKLEAEQVLTVKQTEKMNEILDRYGY